MTAGPFPEPDLTTAEGHVEAAKAALAEQDIWNPTDPAHLSLGVSAVAHLLTVMAEEDLAARAERKTLAAPNPFGPEAYKAHRPGCTCPDCRAAREPEGGRDVVLVTRTDLRELLADSGNRQAFPGDDYMGRLTRAAFADPVDDLAGLSAYSCQICGHIGQPEYWHDTSAHTSVPEGQCGHPEGEIDDEGVCRACDEAVEGPALDAVVLNEISRLLAGPEFPAPWQLFSEIASLVRWTGREPGRSEAYPGPGVRHMMHAGVYDATPEPEGSRLAERDTYIGTWSHQNVTRREPGQ